MRAYHFLKADMTAGSGNEKPWTIGEKRTIKGDIVLCERGYHSSPSWWDALQYAPGPMACLVEITRPVQKDQDKQVSHTRTLIAAVSVERECRLFACDVAEEALHLAKVEDPRSWKAIEVSRKFADGQATDKDLAAARDAARAAAWDAAWAAAWDAAWAAARDAAWAAARDAARAAAWDAARAAARDAAWDAARDAAWDAARDAQTKRFNSVIDGVFEAVGVKP